MTEEGVTRHFWEIGPFVVSLSTAHAGCYWGNRPMWVRREPGELTVGWWRWLVLVTWGGKSA